MHRRIPYAAANYERIFRDGYHFVDKTRFIEGGHIAPTKGDPEGKYLKALKDVVD